ncbi:2-hydroxychromene-2-carboxylate isomerase [Hyphomonas chukchiensis]|nr:2-hydroxychromene-2-carboxylate isomerase [Hyphomonas chukchiensis]|tara:strand:- start:11919 stop:12527 length:609 start_codon:yes stop_codon:yes gene_type:complete
MIEVFFDCSSPWSYFGFEGIQPLAAEFNESLIWRPVLVGGIFNAVNSSVYHVRTHVPAKIAYNQKDIGDWSRITGKVVNFPPRVFPVNSAAAMRACIVLEDQKGVSCVPWARAVYDAYWSQDQDISDRMILVRLADELGFDGNALIEDSDGARARDALRANTQAAIDKGAFGVPTFYIDGTDMYFGVDRLPNLRHALMRKHA